MPKRPSRKNTSTSLDLLKFIKQESMNSIEPTERETTSIPPPKDREDLIAEALILLGVSPDDLDLSPKIEHLFKGIGGQNRIFEYLAGSEDKDARELVKLRKRLTKEQQRYVPFEAYCLAAVLPVKKVFGLISAEALDQEEMAKQLLFRVRHSDVVQATIDCALDPMGSADRRMLHQAAGFVPIPKTSVTFIKGNQINDSSQRTTQIAVLPPVEDTIRRLGDRFNDRMPEVRAIAAPEAAILDAEED